METCDDVRKPFTYLDRKDRQNSKYYFISYSHKDQEEVFDILNKLYAENVNYWYDTELNPGDDWKAEVEERIDNKDYCMGGIVFLSINSMLSKAVHKEIEIMESIADNRDFRIIPVIIGFEKARELIAYLFNSSDEFYKSHGAEFFQKITEKALCLKAEEAAIEISNLAEKENVKEGFHVYERGLNHDILPYYFDNGEKTYLCGEYPFDEVGRNKYIEWKLICNTNDLYYFISKYCIDFIEIRNIDKFISDVKNTMDLVKKNGDDNVVNDVVLIYENFIRDYNSEIGLMIPTDYADRNRQQLLRLFWVLEGDGQKKGCYSLYNAQKIKIDAKILREQINAGVRLLLIIKNR